MLAPEETLKKHGVSAIPSGIVYKGWSFKTNKANIADEAKLVTIARKVSVSANGEEDSRCDDRIDVNGSLLHLPNMIFSNNYLHLYRVEEGGFKMAFLAEDALNLWVMNHRRAGVDAKQLQVPFAWEKEENSTEVKKAHGWDWTFSDTDYCGSILDIDKRTAEVNSRDIVSARHISGPTAQTETVFSFLKAASSSNTESADTSHTGGDQRSDSSSESSSVGTKWERLGSSGINMAMLQERDDILFYDDVVLYQDDLEDCGETTVGCKIRVMPKCVFVLLRNYMRIDNGTIRVRDVRIFHAFPSDNLMNSNPYFNGAEIATPAGDNEYIYMDVTWHQASFATIEANLGRKLEASEMKDPNLIMKSIPLVSQEEGIHKSFRLRVK